MRLISLTFIVRLFASTLLLGVILAFCFILFLPRVYSAEVENGEQVIVIKAPQGGIVRALSVRLGEYVRQDTIVAEIVTTGKQPPDAVIARAILYKRAEIALYESQRGGLKALLLKPDLRARVPLDKDYGRFVAELHRTFSAFQSKLKRDTKVLREQQARLDIQVKGMEREIIDLSQRSALLQQTLIRNGGVQLEVELRRSQNYLKRHNRQISDLRRKARKNAKALLQKTLQVRREEGGGMDKARRELNAFYEQIGLPPNAFDRIGLMGRGGEQYLRSLIARKAGRVVALANGLRPGDVIAAGQEIAQILPTAGRTLYRLRLQKKHVRNLKVRGLSCQDFPNRLVFRENVDIKEDVILLPRKILEGVGFPAPRAGSRCAVILGFAGKFTGDVVLQRLTNELKFLAHNLVERGRIDGRLNFTNDFIDSMNVLLLFIKFESKKLINELNFLRRDDHPWKEVIKTSNELIDHMNKAKKE